MKLSTPHLSLLFTAFLLTPASALQHSHHVQQGRHARAHDGVLARRAAREEMGVRAEGGWVGKRQLVPIGDDDEGDEDTTTTARQATTVISTSAAAVTPPTTSAAVVTPSTTSAATRTPSTPAVVVQTSTSANVPVNTPTASAAPAATSVVIVSESVSSTQQAGDSSTGIHSASASSAVVVPGTATTTPSTGLASSTGLVSATRVSTNAQGSVVFITEVETLSRSSRTGIADAETATVLETMSVGNSNSTFTPKKDSGSGGSLSTGAIVGISVVAGVIVLGLVLFLVWKLKQKRFASFDDDDADGIKWPELNRHGDSAMNLPLPAKPTGGHGFETNAFERGRTDLDGNLIDDDYDSYSQHQHQLSHAGSMHDASPYYHDPSPPLPGSSMSYADTGVYGLGGSGVTRNPSTGASTFLSGHSDDGGMARGLGGSRAFDPNPDAEMMEMTETRNGGLGRSGSGRLL